MQKFILRKCKNFFKLGARKFHFPKYKKNLFLEKYKRKFQSGFFLFFELGLRNASGNPLMNY